MTRRTRKSVTEGRTTTNDHKIGKYGFQSVGKAPVWRERKTFDCSRSDKRRIAQHFWLYRKRLWKAKIGLKNGSEMVKILVPRNGPKMVPGTELGGFMGFLGSFCDFLIFAKSYDHSKMVASDKQILRSSSLKTYLVSTTVEPAASVHGLTYVRPCTPERLPLHRTVVPGLLMK